MVKAEWGAKRICQECGTKFYDMRRPEIVCPKCEAVFKIVPPKPKRAQPAAKETAAEAVPAAVAPVVAKGIGPGDDDADETDELDEIDDIEDVVSDDDDEDEDDEDMIEDTSDLGDDDDDMAEVIQKPAPPDET